MIPIPLSLYIHIPWCIQKCPYCDFNSHKSPQKLPEYEYIDALLYDLEIELPHVSGRSLHSIFIGGGTPSLMQANSIERLLQGVKAMFPFSLDIEVTMEANPGSFELERFAAYNAAGINRLSIGIQSFNQQHLHALGRVHNHQEALDAAQQVRECGFNNFNLDLMFGLPNQSIQQAMSDVALAIEYQPTHLSWYQLTLEPNTLFHKYPPKLPNDDLRISMHEQGIQLLQENGYEQYEVSAYTKDNRECQHNRNYWEYGDYIGIGAGAHGKYSFSDGSILRYQKYRHPQDYIRQSQQKDSRSSSSVVPHNERLFEFMLNALRLKEGVPLDSIAKRTFLAPEVIINALHSAQKKGLLEESSTILKTSPQGWNYLNDTVEHFI